MVYENNLKVLSYLLKILEVLKLYVQLSKIFKDTILLIS